jgi:hypothetical protein
MDATLNAPGLAAPLRIEPSFLKGFKLFVGEQRVKTSFFGGKFMAPGADGSLVAGRIRANVFRAYPKVEIAGVTYDSLAEPPTGLKVVAGLPLALFIIGIGALHAILIFGAIYFNMGVLRSGRRGGVAVVQMLAITLAAGVLVALLVAAIASSMSA